MEDQLIDNELEEVEDISTTSEDGGLDPQPQPVEARLSAEQLEELRGLMTPPPQQAQPEPPKEPEFDQEAFNKHVGYRELTEWEVNRLQDPDTPSAERQKILSDFQRSTFESAVRATDYMNQQKFKQYDAKIQQYETWVRQQEQQRLGQQIQAQLFNDHPVTKAYPQLTQLAAQEVGRTMAGKFQPTPEGIKQLNKAVADRVTALGKEMNLEMNVKKISSSNRTPPNLGGGQTPHVAPSQGKAQGGYAKSEDFSDRAYARTLQKLKALKE